MMLVFWITLKLCQIPCLFVSKGNLLEISTDEIGNHHRYDNGQQQHKGKDVTKNHRFFSSVIASPSALMKAIKFKRFNLSLLLSYMCNALVENLTHIGQFEAPARHDFDKLQPRGHGVGAD